MRLITPIFILLIVTNMSLAAAEADGKVPAVPDNAAGETPAVYSREDAIGLLTFGQPFIGAVQDPVDTWVFPEMTREFRFVSGANAAVLVTTRLKDEMLDEGAVLAKVEENNRALQKQFGEDHILLRAVASQGTRLSEMTAVNSVYTEKFPFALMVDRKQAETASLSVSLMRVTEGRLIECAVVLAREENEAGETFLERSRKICLDWMLTVAFPQPAEALPQAPEPAVVEFKPELPEPPQGFEWVVLPETKGALLKPDKWYFTKKAGPGTFGYFISKEKAVEGKQFSTGFTMTVIPGLARREGMKPSVFMNQYRETARHMEKVIKTWDQEMGPFKAVGFEYLKAYARKQFRFYNLLIANDRTGTLYIVIFEAPEKDWPRAWKIGEVILKRMLIDDEI